MEDNSRFGVQSQQEEPYAPQPHVAPHIVVVNQQVTDHTEAALIMFVIGIFLPFFCWFSCCLGMTSPKGSTGRILGIISFVYLGIQVAAVVVGIILAIIIPIVAVAGSATSK